jgi:hypothetical protein
LDEFITQLLGARELDQFRWRALNMERALVDQFAYDDHGATYISPAAPEPDWGAEWKKLPGCFEMTDWTLQ